MAKKDEDKPGNKKINVSLPEEQIAWLREQRGGISASLRALILEAMNMQRLAESVKKLAPGKKKAVSAKGSSRK